MSEAVERILEDIRKELRTAENALEAENQGMARVCARRAAGIAVAFWLLSHARDGWGIDAMNRLRALQHEDSMPAAVQEAAFRLTSRVTAEFISPHLSNPVADSKIIICHLLNITEV